MASNNNEREEEEEEEDSFNNEQDEEDDDEDEEDDDDEEENEDEDDEEEDDDEEQDNDDEQESGAAKACSRALSVFGSYLPTIHVMQRVYAAACQECPALTNLSIVDFAGVLAEAADAVTALRTQVGPANQVMERWAEETGLSVNPLRALIVAVVWRQCRPAVVSAPAVVV